MSVKCQAKPAYSTAQYPVREGGGVPTVVVPVRHVTGVTTEDEDMMGRGGGAGRKYGMSPSQSSSPTSSSSAGGAGGGASLAASKLKHGAPSRVERTEGRC
ncbi:unnamed protein product [Calypogeia fissa]